MKRCLGVLMLMCLVTVGFAQKGKKEKVDQEYLVYRKALEYADFTVARISIMQLMVKHPDQLAWKDTLLGLYGAMGMHEQAILLGEDILKSRENDTVTLEIVALSYENLGILNKAIEYYEKVLALGDNLILRYKLAVCQYGLQRNGESMVNVEKIITAKGVENLKITITYESSSQDVSLLAAALNVGGIILTDQQKYEDAKAYFESALKLEPNFVLAQNNLQVIIGLMGKSN